MTGTEILELALNVFGGLAIFVFGMKLMSEGLQLSAGERLRGILHMFSANRFVGVVSGAVVTAAIQSSSATTVMVIGFINAGLITLTQAMGIIFGANIGTTLTAQLIAINIKYLIMPAIIVGLIMGFAKKRSITNWGMTVLGFGFLFYGMNLMSIELKELATEPGFRQFFHLFDCDPVSYGYLPLGTLTGAITVGLVGTILLQSSSACTGIVIALGSSGLLDIYTATAIILGSNIGTTVTAQLAAATANKVAKQAALAHTLFNLIGVLIVAGSFFITYHGEPVFFTLVRLLSGREGSIAHQIANAHTVFNVVTTLVLLPFIQVLVKICEKLLPIRESAVRYRRLEPNLLKTPALALTQTSSALRKMLKQAWKNVDAALKLPGRETAKDREILDALEEREADIDTRQKDITEYLSKLMTRPIFARDAARIPVLLHCTNDAERIGDHAEDVKALMDRLAQSSAKFSDEAQQEFAELHTMLAELAKAAVELLGNHSTETRNTALQLRDELSGRLDLAEAEHLARINQGKCAPEAGILFLELLEEIRKISRHLFNIVERTELLYERIPQIPAASRAPVSGD